MENQLHEFTIDKTRKRVMLDDFKIKGLLKMQLKTNPEMPEYGTVILEVDVKIL